MKAITNVWYRILISIVVGAAAYFSAFVIFSENVYQITTPDDGHALLDGFLTFSILTAISYRYQKVRLK